MIQIQLFSSFIQYLDLVTLATRMVFIPGFMLN